VTKKGRNQLDQALSALDAFLSGMVSVANGTASRAEPDSATDTGARHGHVI
jgi:hypothetical protein